MFEFTTKEEREAWRVFKPSYLTEFGETGYACRKFDEAAARFDQREATCGIEPLSEEHARLILSVNGYAGTTKLVQNKLVEFPQTDKLTDKGRAVLANLNAMCKVQS